MELSKTITAKTQALRLLNKEEHTCPCMREEFFTILIDGEFCSVLSATPSNMDEFVIGHLISSGLINNRYDIVSCRLCESNRFYVVPGEDIKLKIYTAGGVSQYIRSVSMINREQLSIISSIRIYTPKEINDICRITDDNKELQRASALGFYAGTVQGDSIISLFFDIREANVLDKLIGSLVPENRFDEVLITNTRPTAEIIQRCYTAKAPVGIFKGIPSNYGLYLANKSAITVISTDKPREYLIFADSARRIRNLR